MSLELVASQNPPPLTLALHPSWLPHFAVLEPWLFHLEAAPSCRCGAWAQWARQSDVGTSSSPHLDSQSWPKAVLLPAAARCRTPNQCCSPTDKSWGQSGGDTSWVPCSAEPLGPALLNLLEGLQGLSTSLFFPPYFRGAQEVESRSMMLLL